MKKRILSLLLALLMIFSIFTACSDEEINTALGMAETIITVLEEYDTGDEEGPQSTAPESVREEPAIDEDGEYTGKEEVALYIYTYGCLPSNFITKSEAGKLGWVSSEGNLWDVAPGKSIGGDRFGNYEEKLPRGDYLECDIDYEGGYRGEKRIVFSDEGIYYTEDHYNSFEQLY